jgi:DNA-binding GntR family transcriptional regulator
MAKHPFPDQTHARSAATKIYEHLVAAIVDHRLPPGTKLPEDRLAEVYGASRARIREILLGLGHERLVTLQPNRGAFVAEPTVRETQEICEARRIIEAATVTAAVRNADKVALERLRDLVEQEDTAWRRNDQHAAVRLSREFHACLAEIAGNSILSDTLRNILARNSLSVAIYERRGSPGCLCSEHYSILDAIERRDAESAQQLMIQHLNHIEERMNLTEPEGKEVDIVAILREAL